MSIQILQINLNHSLAAQDACMNFVNNNSIDITCVSEPYKILDT